ncbi:MAG: hypothetical protein ACP5OP_01455 [Leptospirillia bacterium]
MSPISLKRATGALALLLVILSPGSGFGGSRSHRYYPSTSPQYSSQLEIESVSLLFRNNNILVSDTRHTIVFINVSGLSETVPQIEGNSLSVRLSSGQAAVVAGNTHTAPLPLETPLPALSVGINPLSISESDGLLYIADGSGRIDALNLDTQVHDIILIPDSKIRLNAGAHISRLLKRSPTIGKLLGMATTLPLDPGKISVIAGGGRIPPSKAPIDALRARISPIGLSSDAEGIYVVGETGHILYLNNTATPHEIPVREGRSTRIVSVRPGEIFLVASRGEEHDLRPGADPVPAISTTMYPTTIIASKGRIFTADQDGNIDMINLTTHPLTLPGSPGESAPRTLEPGMVLRIAGGGTRFVGFNPHPALEAMIRPHSMTYDPRGFLYIGDIEETHQAGRILAVNVSDKSLSLPLMRHGAFRKLTVAPGEIVAIAGNSRTRPLATTTPTPAGDAGIEPIQLSYRNGLLAIGNLLGSLDLVNLTFRNRRAFPNDVHSSLLLPPGTILSLMGNGFDSSQKPSDEAN